MSINEINAWTKIYDILRIMRIMVEFSFLTLLIIVTILIVLNKIFHLKWPLKIILFLSSSSILKKLSPFFQCYLVAWLGEQYLKEAVNISKRNLERALTYADEAFGALEICESPKNYIKVIKVQKAYYQTHAEILQKLGNWNAAAIDLEKLIENIPLFLLLDSIFLELAYVYSMVPDFKNRLKTLRSGYKNFPKSVEVKDQLIKCLVEHRLEVSNEKAWDKVIIGCDDKVLASCYKTCAEINIKSGKWKAAAINLEKLIELQPADLLLDSIFLELAYVYSRVPDINKRLETLRRAYEGFPTSLEVKAQLIKCLDEHRLEAYNEKAWDKVIIDCDELIKLYSDNPQVISIYYLDRANARRMTGDNQGAISDAEAVLKNSPTNSDAYLHLGWAKLMLRKYAAAESDLTKAIEIKEENGDMINLELVFYGRAKARLYSADYKGAIEDYTVLIDGIDLKLPKYYAERGEAHYRLRNNDAAIQDLNEAINLGTEDARIHVLRGDVYRFKEDLDHAIADYQEARCIEPDYYPADYGSGLTYVQKSSAILEQRNTEKIDYLNQARKYLNEAINKAENQKQEFSALYLELGNVESILGNHKEAQRLRERARSLGGDAAIQGSQEIFRYQWQKLEAAFRELDPKGLHKTRDEFVDQTLLEPNNANAHYGAGLLYLKEEKTAEAIKYLNKVIELNGKFAEAYFYRAWARGLNKDWEGVIADSSQALVFNSSQLSQVYWLRGLAYNKINNLERAIGDFCMAIEYSPKYIDAQKDLIWTRAQNKEWTKAIEESGRAIDLGIRNAVIYTLLAEAYRMTGKPNQAVSFCTEALGLEPKYALAFRTRGLALVDEMKYFEAIKDFDMVIELDDKDAMAYCGRGAAFRLNGNLDEAMIELEKSVKLFPKFALAFYHMGWTRVQFWEKTKQDGYLDLAAQDFDQVIKLEKTSPDGYCGRGEVYRLKGQLDDALGQLSRATIQNPTFYLAYHIRGWVHYQKGEWDAALRNFSKALEFTAISMVAKDIYYGRAESYRMKKEWDTAIRDYTEVIKRDAAFAPAYHMRGWVRTQQNDWSGAIEDYTSAINIAISKGLDLINFFVSRAWAYYETNCTQEALDDLREALKLNPKSLDAYLTLGNVLLYLEQWDEAIANYTEVIKLDQNSDTGYGNRGVARIYKGDLQGALEDLTGSIDLNDKNAGTFEARAWAKVRLGDWDGAITDCDKAIELDRFHFFAYNTRSLARWRKSDQTGTLEDLWNIVEIRLPNFHLQDLKRKREDSVTWGACSQDWGRAVEKGPPDALAYLGRGISKWLAGELKAAIDDLTKSIDINPNLLESKRLLELVHKEIDEQS